MPDIAALGIQSLEHVGDEPRIAACGYWHACDKVRADGADVHVEQYDVPYGLLLTPAGFLDKQVASATAAGDSARRLEWRGGLATRLG